MLTKRQKRKLLSDLLSPEQHIKMEEGDTDFMRTTNQKMFGLDSELVQDLSISKRMTNEHDKMLSDDECDDLDSQSMSSIPDDDGRKVADNSDSLATEEDDDADDDNDGDDDDNDEENDNEHCNQMETKMIKEKIQLDIVNGFISKRSIDEEMNEKSNCSSGSLDKNDCFELDTKISANENERADLAMSGHNDKMTNSTNSMTMAYDSPLGDLCDNKFNEWLEVTCSRRQHDGFGK